MRLQFFFIIGLFLTQSCYSYLFAQNSEPINRDSIDATELATTNNQIKVTDFIIPTLLTSYGLVGLGSNEITDLNFTLKSKIRSKHPDFHIRLDDFTAFAPSGAVFLLNGLGIKGKHSWQDATLIYIGSLAITASFVLPIKHITHIKRPDDSAYNSFPSGHTATAFASAEFLRREYRHISPWIGVAGYVVATGTGVLRMYNNRHWFSDVVAGAGFGIASTMLSYFIYEKIKAKNSKWSYQITPTYYRQNIGVAFVTLF